MTLLLVGIAVFFASHLFTTYARSARQRLIDGLGAGPYRGLYSLVALAGLALIIIGWRGADVTIVYTTPLWVRHFVYVLMLAALILLAASLAPKGRIAAAVKHPMLASVKIWAFAHLLINGDVRSLTLFGAFLIYAVLARIAAKQRGVATPLAGPMVNDAIAVGVGGALWALIFFWLHPFIAGVSLVG